MKKKLSDLKEQFGFHKKIVIFLIGLAIVGVIMGSFFTVLLSDGDKTFVREYMQNFINGVEKGKVDILGNLIHIGIDNFFFVAAVWLLGISVIGIPIILFLYFAKAFVLGFSISSFLLTYKAKGLLYAFLYIFPHQIVNFALYILLLNYAMILSFKLIRSFLYKKTIDFKVVMKKYCFVFGFVLLCLFVTSLYEGALAFKILKFSLSIFS